MKKKKLKPTILLSNDDGIDAPGLFALYEALKPVGKCVIVAPDTDISAVSHGITMKKPIRVKKHFRDGVEYGWAVSGTPVDCIKFAAERILDQYPDIIVSGINQGSNASINAVYSGTVAAAAEGGIMNIPSIALSIASHTFNDFSTAAEVARTVSEKVLKEGLPEYTFLNINIPPVEKEKIVGIKITKMGKMRYIEKFDKRLDPSKRPYYWLRGQKLILEESEDSDEIALSNNYVTVAPLQYDLTNYKAIDVLNKWNISLNNRT